MMERLEVFAVEVIKAQQSALKLQTTRLDTQEKLLQTLSLRLRSLERKVAQATQKVKVIKFGGCYPFGRKNFRVKSVDFSLFSKQNG